MIKKIILYSLFSLIGFAGINYAAVCPDPNASSLQWGEIPPPWMADPFSNNQPQGEPNTQFVRANIMIANVGRGIVCTYKNSLGDYSIWWPVLVKIPSTIDYRWIDTAWGFVCTLSRDQCQFTVAQ
jgi:hypothetical protein